MFDERYNRQSFLGEKSQENIVDYTVGIIGLGGGGSHIVQQLAHIGFRKYVIYDPDVIEATNLNRLIGAKTIDVKMKRKKTLIARRIIKGLQEDAEILAFSDIWQNDSQALAECDIIFGCVDGYKERMELEAFSRRYLIPYIDIGIDVHEIAGEPPCISGQIIVSIPGGPCMKCLGFITEEKLSKESRKYGTTEPNPQVVWANGVVASTAVGLAVNLLSGWTKASPIIYLCYEGNIGTLSPHVRLKYMDTICCHYVSDEVGEMQLKRL